MRRFKVKLLMSSVAAESRSDSPPHRTGFPFGEASFLRSVNHPSGKLGPARRVAISVRVLVLMRARKHEGSPVRSGRAAPRERANIHFAVSTGAHRDLFPHDRTFRVRSCRGK